MQGIHPSKAVLALITPVAAAASGWLCAAVAKYGVHLEPAGVTALATAGIVGAVGLGVKLIHDVETGHPDVTRELAVVEKAAAPELEREAQTVEAGWWPDTAPAPEPAPKPVASSAGGPWSPSA